MDKDAPKPALDDNWLDREILSYMPASAFALFGMAPPPWHKGNAYEDLFRKDGKPRVRPRRPKD